MRDLLAYLVVLMLFAISFGVMIQAVLYPSQPLNARLFSDVLRRPYFQIYGELFLEELEGITFNILLSIVISNFYAFFWYLKPLVF